jgi:hypothetical protein
MQPHEKTTTKSKKGIMFNNFLGGIAWAAGSIIGAIIIVSLLSLLIKYVDVVPMIGDFIADILYYLKVKQAIT